MIINLKFYVRINIEKDITGIPNDIVIMFQRMKDIGIERFGTHPEKNFNGFLRDESHAQDNAQNIVHMIELEVNIHKRSRANTGVIPEMSESINPKSFVDTLFVIAGAMHPKANLNMEEIDPEQYIVFTT